MRRKSSNKTTGQQVEFENSVGARTLSGRPLSFWKPLSEGVCAIEKPLPISTAKKMAKKEIAVILDSINYEDECVAIDLFKTAVDIFPKLCDSDISQIILAGIGSEFDAVYRLAADTFYNRIEKLGQKEQEDLFKKFVILCARSGRIEGLIEISKRTDLNGECISRIISKIEGIIPTSLKFSVNRRFSESITKLLNTQGVCDKIMIEAMKACARNGRIDIIAKLNEREDISEKVRSEIEPAIILGIKVCRKNSVHHWVEELLKRSDLSDSVLTSIIAACRYNLWDSTLSMLFDKKEVKDEFLIMAVRALRGWQRNEIIAELMKRVDFSTPVMTELIVYCGKYGLIAELLELRERTDLDKELIKSIESAIKIATKYCVKSGDYDSLNLLLDRTDQNKKLFFNALKFCRREGRLNYMHRISRSTLFDIRDKQKIENEVIAGIRICKKKEIHKVYNLLDNTDLSDRVIAEIIKAFIRSGNASHIAGIAERKNLSDEIRASIEPAIRKTIRFCAEQGHHWEISNLITFAYMTISQELFDEVISICKEKGWKKELENAMQKYKARKLKK